MSAPRRLEHEFRTEQSETRVLRMWREVEASRATGASVGRWRALALAATIGCALAAVGLAFWARGPGALLLEDGSSIPASLQASGTARLTTFSDESRVRLSPR